MSFWRIALSVRSDKTLASALDNEFGGIVDKNERHPRVQWMVHRKLRRSAIELFDYECRKTHRCPREWPPQLTISRRRVDKISTLAKTIADFNATLRETVIIIGVVRMPRIKRALSLLATVGLVYLERILSTLNERGTTNAYRLAYLDSYNYMGTRGRNPDFARADNLKLCSFCSIAVTAITQGNPQSFPGNLKRIAGLIARIDVTSLQSKERKIPARELWCTQLTLPAFARLTWTSGGTATEV